MKTKFLFVIALAFGVSAFAQKKEVKALQKAIKSGNFGEAKNLVAQQEVAGWIWKTKDMSFGRTSTKKRWFVHKSGMQMDYLFYFKEPKKKSLSEASD